MSMGKGEECFLCGVGIHFRLDFGLSEPNRKGGDEHNAGLSVERSGEEASAGYLGVANECPVSVAKGGDGRKRSKSCNGEDKVDETLEEHLEQ